MISGPRCSATLLQALDIAGGIQALARRLHVPKKQLEGWLEGEVETPPAVLLRALDILRRVRKLA